ncbi:MAG: WD40 repeat domain-containing protein [Bacteroidales bacterium]|jgi:WD40 repeat protein|nr:WD40 repeat domain-containing protein [Bacteroidales bacterium]
MGRRLILKILFLAAPVLLFSQTTELSVQTGHVEAIRKIVFSPDGKYLASSDDLHKICIWDMAGLAQMTSFFFPEVDEGELVTSLAFSPDNNLLAAGTMTGKLLIWDIGNSRKKSFISIDEEIYDIRFLDASSCLILGTRLQLLDIPGNTIRLIDERKIGDVIVDKAKKEITWCAINGELGTISYADGFRINVSELSENDFVKLQSRKYTYLNTLKLGRDGLVAAGSYNMVFFDLPARNKVFSAASPYMDEHITDLEYLPSGNCFLVSNTDGKIYIFDFATHKLIKVLKDHISEVNTLAVHPVRNIFASGSSDRSIILWDAANYTEIKRFYARATAIGCMDLSEPTQTLAFGNELGYTKTIKLDDKNPDIVSVKNHRQKINDIEFVNNDENIITCSNDNHLVKLKTKGLEVEKSEKYKSSFGIKYLLSNIIVKLNLYADPYVFTDSLSLTGDQKHVIAYGHETKKKFMKARPVLENYEFLYTADDLKRRNLKSYPVYNEKMIRPDSIILGVRIYNRENGHTSAITEAILDSSVNRLITSSTDATIKIWDINTGRLIVTIIPVDKDKRVFITPDNYYFAPKNSLNAIGFKQGTDFYPTEQFDLKFNRPDIVLERLGYSDTGLIKVYKNAYAKRLRKSGFNEEMFTSEWHTPEVKILNADETGYATGEPEVTLSIRGTDSRYNLDRLNVWVNDVPVYGINGISVRGEAADSVVRTISVPLSEGQNRISVSYMNEKGVESLKASKEMVFDPGISVKPDLYVIALSVSEYKDNRFNLQYSVKDGKDIANMFGSVPASSGEYNRIIIDTLFNRKAVRENFFELKEKLMKTKVDDQVILFASGHGLLDKNLDFYFASWDIDFRHPETRGISFDDMENLLDSIPARKKLLMVDACHSGEVDKENEPGLMAVNVERSEDITFRGNVREYNFRGVAENTAVQSGSSLDNSFELMQELFAGLDKGTGTTVISAAAGKGYALESDKWNNGVFTYTILNGLKYRAADKNKDRKITVSELKDYSIRQVVDLTGGKQKPTARRESIGLDWRIW